MPDRRPICIGTGIQPTYEELKPLKARNTEEWLQGIQPTYEELKLEKLTGRGGIIAGIQPTYEELKRREQAYACSRRKVSSLPMRN